MRICLAITFLALSGCQKPESVEQDEYQRLEERVATLEAKFAELASQPVAAPIAPVALPTPRPSQTRMAFRLIGTSSRNEEIFEYATSEECEVAMQALLDSWLAEDERNRSRGVVYTNRPTPSCIPL